MFRKIMIGGVTAAVIVGAGGAALAATGADSTNGSPSTPTNAKQHDKNTKHGKHDRGRRLLRHLDHADVVLHTKKKGDVDLHLIRGTVSSVSSSSITVVSADKTSETFAVPTDTKIHARENGKRTDATIGDVATGDHVFVAGVGTSAPVAKRVLDRGSK